MTFSFRMNDEESQILKSYAKLKKQSVTDIVHNAVLEQIDTEYNLKLYEKAMENYKTNPVTYTQEDVEKELGLI